MALKDLREYRSILEAAIAEEEAHKGDQPYLGWEWYQVQAYPATLVKLVVEGVIKVNYKSRSTTAYLLVDRAKTKAALS